MHEQEFQTILQQIRIAQTERKPIVLSTKCLRNILLTELDYSWKSDVLVIDDRDSCSDQGRM